MLGYPKAMCLDCGWIGIAAELLCDDWEDYRYCPDCDNDNTEIEGDQMAAKKVVKIGKDAELKFYEKSVVFQATNIYLQREVTKRDIEDITKFCKRAFEEGQEHERRKIEIAWETFKRALKFSGRG